MRSCCAGGAPEGRVSQLESYGVCFRTWRRASTGCSCCKERAPARGSLTTVYLFTWDPRCCNQVRTELGILGPEGTAAPCSDTCHLRTSLVCPSLPGPSAALGPAGDTHALLPIMVTVGGTLQEMARKGAGMWELTGGRSSRSLSRWPEALGSSALMVVTHHMLKAFV